MTFDNQRSYRSGRIVCKCKRGYGSEYDGKCTRCRGMTAWESKLKEALAGLPIQRGSYLMGGKK